MDHNVFTSVVLVNGFPVCKRSMGRLYVDQGNCSNYFLYHLFFGLKAKMGFYQDPVVVYSHQPGHA